MSKRIYSSLPHIYILSKYRIARDFSCVGTIAKKRAASLFILEAALSGHVSYKDAVCFFYETFITDTGQPSCA
jgi:hypothetical protein